MHKKIQLSLELCYLRFNIATQQQSTVHNKMKKCGYSNNKKASTAINNRLSVKKLPKFWFTASYTKPRQSTATHCKNSSPVSCVYVQIICYNTVDACYKWVNAREIIITLLYIFTNSSSNLHIQSLVATQLSSAHQPSGRSMDITVRKQLSSGCYGNSHRRTQQMILFQTISRKLKDDGSNGAF